MKRYFVPLVPLLCFVVGCGIDKKNKQSKKNIEMPVEVLKNPELSLKATAPRDILYVSKNIANNQQSNLFLAEKDGGLGADLDQDNKLIPYKGIPVEIEAKDLLGKPKVSVVAAAATAARNDEKCSQLFTYNESLKLIQVQTDKITGLSICNVTVSAASEEDKVYADSASFEIAVNLPFSEYMKKSDNSAKYIQKYLGISDRNLDKSIDITAKHLKDKKNKQSLVLDFDDNKVTKEDQLEFLDAITGAQSIKSLSLAKTNLINLNAVAKLENLESLDISDTKVSESDFKLLSKLSKLKKLAVRDLDIKDFSNIVRYFPQLEELDISNNKRIVNISTLKDMKNLRVLKVANIGLTSIAPLEHLTELTSLDIANNDLSNIQSSSYSILSNLYNLAHLNTSFTKIPDTFLNEYFNTASAQKIKTFINRNHFKRFQVGNCQYNNFEKIANLQKLVNLEYLDISGNSCQTEKGKFQGLLTTKPLQKMSQLKTLNIANNIISDLNHIKHLEIPKIVLNELDTQNNAYQRETGIYATREDCRSILGAHERACSTLSVDLPNEIVKNPTLSFQATIPDDILYVAANNTLSKYSNKNSSVKKLIPYAGIPITLQEKDLTAKPKVSVVAAAVTSAKNDEKCPELFTYNENLNLIQIHTDKITGLSICNVTVSATAEADNVSASPTTFEVALNLTFLEHAKKKDRAAKYIQKYLGISDSVINNSENFFENYLKENNQNLVLDFDDNKVTKEDGFEFLDAITSAQSIKSLSLAKTNLSNLNAIARLENLESLDISNTKVSEADLKLLSKLPILKKLAVRDLDIKDFSNITQYLANLEELDIGNNRRIASLNTLKDMKNLRALKISNTNLNTLDPLQTLSQLVYLDISHNDLSNISSGSYAMLSNLSNLNYLNTSFTKIPDSLLNEYFNTASAQKLKTFINRNHFKRFQVGNCQYNNFENILNLQRLVNLEYLDISSNSCQTEKGKFQGLLTTKPLQKMSQLKTLNIANNIISDLNHIKNLEIPKIILNELDKQNNVYQRETGIYATREECRSILGAHERACSTLSVDLPNEIVKNPTLSLQPLVPQETLYASSGAVGKPESNRRSRRAIRHGSERIIYNHEGNLFRAEKDGGLGADLDQDNKLIPYSGIPVEIEAKDLTGKPKVSVVAEAVTTAKNDEKCPDLFSYNENLNLIQIHTDKITGLSICKVTVSASSETDKVYSETVSFEVALNLTFSEYVKKSDPSTKYIKKYIGNEENDLNRVAYYLARYLKDKQNSQNLVLDFDETKFKKDDQFEFFDSITGAQSIKSLSVAKINLVNVNAIMKLENLEALDISGTKISETDLKLLSRLSKLKKLAVRDLDIKDLANITRFLPSLEELDISENKRVVNISTLKDMENLRVLKVSNIGLTSLEPIELLTQLNSLDLSKNDLSNMDKSQYTILANLYNLAHLNTSFTKISDEFLNNYFDVTSAQRLLTFINRNHFNRSQVGNCQYNNFEEISNLRKLVNLEYLDISGNSCQVQKSVFKGLLTTTPFKYMYNLKTLNISNNIISDLNGIKLLDLNKLVLNELNTKDSVYPKETGLPVTREACVNILGLYQRACSTLSSGKFVTVKFDKHGDNEWTVPPNVFKVRLLGASGSNGGSGGGGSGAANSCHHGNWAGCGMTRGGNGGNGGKANGGLINNGQQGKSCRNHVEYTDPSGTNGSDAEDGGLTQFKNILFSRAAEYIKDGFYPRNRIRKGGIAGANGESRKGKCDSYGNSNAGEIISGGAGGAGINGWNSLVETYETEVIPGEKIKFYVGKGGRAGKKGVGGVTPWAQRMFWSNNGLDGTDGTDGEHGFLEITYEIYQ